MIKILHVITGLNTGGAETMLYKLLSKMDKSVYSQAVISLSDKGSVGELIESLGIPVYSLDMKHTALAPVYVVKLIRLVRSFSPDLIQGWMYHGNLAAQIGAAGIMKAVPVLWNIRCTYTAFSVQKKLTSFLIWLGGRFSTLPFAIVNNSKDSARAHQEKFGYLPEKWEVIPNGFDVDLFRPDVEAREKLCAELGVKCDSFLIGLVGRYHPVKGHITFLSAAALIVKKCTNVHFVLIGSNIDINNKDLVGHIDAHNLHMSVHLLGNRADIVPLTAALDVACSSSYAEGFSNAIGEAMSSGVPCVVTGVGDSGWIVGETGRVVPPGDPVQLANAWGELIAMGAKGRRALGATARQRIIDNFSLESIVSQYVALYQKVLKNKKEGF